jgi:ribosomal protein S18 acetylase RimI-like enzyme
VEIREMEVRDIGAVRKVARQTWADTYEGVIPEDVQQRFLGHAYSEGSLVRRMEAGVFLVAVEDGEVVGFADLSPAPEEPGAVELVAIYVLPGLQGRGVGTRLLQTGLGRRPPAKKVTAEVERENLAARRFYEARGFAQTSRRTQRAFGQEFRTVEMTLVIEEDE